MKITYRNAKPQDWKIIQKLNHEVFLNDAPNDKYLDTNWPFSSKGVFYYKNATSKKEYCCLIAEIKKSPIGYIIGIEKNYDYRTNKVAEIEDIGVSPDHRSKGVGSQLITHFKKWCKKNKLTHIYVNAYYKNKKARNFYTKQKLKPIDISFEGKI
jgi:GNAT superfamily N-acetyltransferase